MLQILVIIQINPKIQQEVENEFFSDNRNVSAGDLSQRKELKDRLKCKSFRWYLENIYPESMMLKEIYYFGEVSNHSILQFQLI